jgi:hypothetical protein
MIEIWPFIAQFVAACCASSWFFHSAAGSLPCGI